MPSVALRLRADGDGDGYADIWRNELDGLASIANYLRDAGWKPNVAWGIPVRTPGQPQPRRDRHRGSTAPRCPQVYRRHSRWLTMREWRALGRDAARPLAARQRDGEPDRARRARRHRLSADHQLSRRSSITIARISTRFRSGFWRTRLRGDRQAGSPPRIGDLSPAPCRAPSFSPPPPRFSSPAPRPPPRRSSIRRPRSPILIDLSSGAVLYAKNADVRMPPASMAKMMTTEVAFELIDKGQLPLNKMCTVRPETWQKWHGPQAGSTMFLSPERAGQRRESAARASSLCRATTRRSCSPNASPGPSRPSPTR